MNLSPTFFVAVEASAVLEWITGLETLAAVAIALVVLSTEQRERARAEVRGVRSWVEPIEFPDELVLVEVDG